MSDSDQLSGESSLSLFSGFGTSSVSGGSDLGGAGAGINVEELSDKKLESLLEDTKTALRQIVLETLMFESYFERLSSGQISLSPTSRGVGHSGSGGGQSRKGSGTMSGGADTLSDTDSQPPTAGTSLLDVRYKV